jgi:peptide/nickel transport system substrate-binding protein
MRFVRRGPLTLLLALGLPLLALGWAFGAGGGAGQDTYREAVLGRPARVNPLFDPTSDAEGDLVALVFAGLMRIRGDGTPDVDLAESWELNPDGLTYTFRLRDGLTWHDGVPLDAYDVAFTVARIQSPDFEGSASLAAEWAGVQTFVADARTVLFRLPEPSAGFLVRAAAGILPRHLEGEMSASALEVPPFDRAPVGAGPYRLVALEADRAVLEHNTSYHHGAPRIPRIVLRFAETPEVQARLLRDGVVDAALFGEQQSPAETSAVEARDDDVETVLVPRAAYTILYFNNQRAPLANADLRRAIAATVDRAAVLAAAGDVRASGGDGPIVPGSWAYIPSTLEAPSLDALWEASGWSLTPEGRRNAAGQALALTLVTNLDPAREAMAREIARQLEAAGVSVEVLVEPATRVVTDYLRAQDFDLALFAWEAAPDPDPYHGWHSSQIGGLGGNVAGFRDPEADALLEAARTTADTMERRELYALFIRRFEERGASLVLAYRARAYAIPARLEGFEPGLLFSPASRFRDVHLWRWR